MRVRKSIHFVVLLAVAGLGLEELPAQPTNEVEQLRQQLRELQANFERVQRQQQQQIEALTRKLDAVTQPQSAEAEKKKLEPELTTQLSTNAPPAPSAAAPTVAWSPSQPLTVFRAGSAYMNLSFDALLDFGGSTASDRANSCS